MGFFRRREKEYTLGEAMKLLAKEGYETYMPVPINPEDEHTKYWIRDEREIRRENTPISIGTEPRMISFEAKRSKFMDEMSNHGEYRFINGIHVSHSTKPGRVVYNNYQSARNYQKKYGQSR